MLEYITWNADPLLIDSFVKVRWYGLMFAVGFTLGYNIVARMFKHEGEPESWLGILLIWLVVGTVVGARLGHVFFYEWDVYSKDPIRILYIWEGGLASHGGTIGVMICLILFSVITAKKNPIWTFDRIVVPIALVGALIRIGNLMNSEIYGHYTTLPWGFIFVRNGETLPAHPTQIYEALCYFALFALLFWMYWRRNAEERMGLLTGTFFIGCFGSRFFVEFVKNPQVAWEQGMALNMGQLLSIPFILLGVAFIIYAYSRPRLHMHFPNHFADEPKQKAKQKK